MQFYSLTEEIHMCILLLIKRNAYARRKQGTSIKIISFIVMSITQIELIVLSACAYQFHIFIKNKSKAVMKIKTKNSN